MLDFLTKFFRRDEPSKSLAKDRLRFVLMSDRISLAPETFDAMKGEMLSVLQRYLEIDERGLDVHFENAERRFMLLANIPVNNVKTLDQIRSEALRAPETTGPASALEDAGRKAQTNGVTAPSRRRRRRRSQRNGVAGHAGAGLDNSLAETPLAEPQAQPPASQAPLEESPRNGGPTRFGQAGTDGGAAEDSPQ